MEKKFTRSGLETSLLGYGSAPIGNLFRSITTDVAHQTVHAAWDAGIRFYDTAPLYGHGLAEHRMADALFQYPREEYVLCTKVGRTLTPSPAGSFDHGSWEKVPPLKAEFDYSFDATFRQVEQSSQRMMSDKFDILLVHDIDFFTHGTNQPQRFQEAIQGSFKALIQMREEGTVSAIGVGVNETDVCYDVAKLVDIDTLLLAGRYTLLEQESLDNLMPLCEERGISVILGGVFNSGILATGATPEAKFNYGKAPKHILEKTQKIQSVCNEFGVSLPAAAIQFAAAHPAVVNICLGARDLDQWNKNFTYLREKIPTDFWQSLRQQRLIREDAPTPT